MWWAHPHPSPLRIACASHVRLHGCVRGNVYVWCRLDVLDTEGAQVIVAETVQAILSATLGTIETREIDAALKPFAAQRLKEFITATLELDFLNPDPGEPDHASDQTWRADDEPTPCAMDSWQTGAMRCVAPPAMPPPPARLATPSAAMRPIPSQAPGDDDDNEDDNDMDNSDGIISEDRETTSDANGSSCSAADKRKNHPPNSGAAPVRRSRPKPPTSLPSHTTGRKPNTVRRATGARTAGSGTPVRQAQTPEPQADDAPASAVEIARAKTVTEIMDEDMKRDLEVLRNARAPVRYHERGAGGERRGFPYCVVL
eukprot:m.199086 g.199086  ORF g.199086 m.199086 type:complete len:315 (-) comp10655_c1_seq4:514-1458(-)